MHVCLCFTSSLLYVFAALLLYTVENLRFQLFLTLMHRGSHEKVYLLQEQDENFDAIPDHLSVTKDMCPQHDGLGVHQQARTHQVNGSERADGL